MAKLFARGSVRDEPRDVGAALVAGQLEATDPEENRLLVGVERLVELVAEDVRSGTLEETPEGARGGLTPMGWRSESAAN